MVRVSPDGAWLSFLAPEEGVLNVWVAPVSDPGAARAITHDRGRGITAYGWVPSAERVLTLQDRDGDENWRLEAVDPTTGQTTDLTPLSGVQAQLWGTSPRHPHQVVVGINDRDERLHDPHLIDIRTGERTRLLENPGFVGMTFDWDLQPVYAVQPTPDGGLVVVRHQDGAWAPVAEVSQEDALTTRPVHGTADGASWYWIDGRGRDTAALVRVDLASGATTVEMEDPRADVSDVTADPATGVVDGAWSTYEASRFVPVGAGGERLGGHLEHLATLGRGEVEIASRTLDDSLWVVAWLPEDGPIAYGLYWPETRHMQELFSSRTGLRGQPLARRRPHVIPSRDGLSLVSYLSLPPWLDRDGRPPEPLPMVLYVHGGPWARDMPGFEPFHQVFANRGYAVLSVNFRGSTGFGKRFINAGDYEWAGKMHDDLLDAVEWAVQQGVAKRDAVAIMGGSYGGYATLVGLTFTPEVFACGIDIVGPSSLVTLLGSIPPYWAPMKAQFTTRVGDDTTEEGRAELLARSPLSRVDEIVRPLLIAQGANDPRVKQAEADQIVAAMQARSIPVTYALFPDEGHGFSRPENKIAFVALAEAFLAEHLGGRREPDDGATAASSVEIR